MPNTDTINYIKAHLEDDVNSLLLSSNNKKNKINIKEAALQILARQKAKNKLPEWYNNFDLIFPAPISVEQSSSILTAKYKQRFSEGKFIADITGGFGADTYYLSKNALKVNYFEKNDELVRIATNNFRVLKQNNIIINNGDFLDNLSQLNYYDLIYADPSRRDEKSIKKIQITEYEPNIAITKNELFKYSNHILVKISPMADISATLKLLEETSEIHIVSVNNECKELLFYLDKNCSETKISIFTANLHNESNKNQYFNYILEQENRSIAKIVNRDDYKYLYEPNSSILKAGAFRIIGNEFFADKLNKNTHLYASNELINDFPGRKFSILEIVLFNKKSIESISKKYPKANIATRNFPISAKKLHHRLNIDDGGDIYIFGVIFYDESKRLVICTKAN